MFILFLRHSYAGVYDEENDEEKGQILLENRLYAFHTGLSSLARLDTSALDHLRDPTYPDEPPMFDVVSVEKDLSELVLEVNGVSTVRVKADLKSPHKLIPASSQESLGQTSTPGRSAIFSPSLAGRHTPPVRQPFPWLWLLAIVAVMLGVSATFTVARGLVEIRVQNGGLRTPSVVRPTDNSF